MVSALRKIGDRRCAAIVTTKLFVIANRDPDLLKVSRVLRR